MSAINGTLTSLLSTLKSWSIRSGQSLSTDGIRFAQRELAHFLAQRTQRMTAKSTENLDLAFQSTSSSWRVLLFCSCFLQCSRYHHLFSSTMVVSLSRASLMIRRSFSQHLRLATWASPRLAAWRQDRSRPASNYFALLDKSLISRCLPCCHHRAIYVNLRTQAVKS